MEYLVATYLHISGKFFPSHLRNSSLSVEIRFVSNKYKGYRRVSSQIHQFLVDNLNDLSRKSYPKCQITSKLFWLSIE